MSSRNYDIAMFFRCMGFMQGVRDKTLVTISLLLMMWHTHIEDAHQASGVGATKGKSQPASQLQCVSGI
jgi:hypothetical protein